MSFRLTLAFVIVMLSMHGEARQSQARVPERRPLPAGTGAISGRVIDANTEQPLANVMVSLAALGPVAGNRQTTTDANGFYQFVNLAAHDYHVVLMDALYLPGCYGASLGAAMPCDTITVARDQHRAEVDVRLIPGAIVRGRVVEADGRAVAGATVIANPPPTAPPALGPPAQARSRPDGTFEITRVAGGEAILSLEMPVTGDRPRTPTIFYPGVFSAEAAEPIRVTAGLVTAGIVFTMPPTVTRSLHVRISLPAAGAEAVRAWLYRVEPRMSREIVLDAGGAGSVGGLLEGRYFIAARGLQDHGTLAAYEVAEVVHDRVDVALLLQETGAIVGKVVGDRGEAPPAGVRVVAQWTDDDVDIDPLALDEATVAPDGSFRIGNLLGDRRIRVQGLPAEWQVRSIRHGRSDLPAAGVTIGSGATADLTIVVGRR